MGADPIGAAVAMASVDTPQPIPMFIVRKEPKGHGTRQMIENMLGRHHGDYLCRERGYFFFAFFRS